MGKILGHLEPKAVWNYFEEICQYPRPSKKEEKIAAYMMGWAKENKFETKRDKAGNIIVRKPATKGMENRKPIAIQGHIDMVCEKNNDVKFDFDKDPIQPWIDGDWVKAKGTTLGADNGIGVSMGMALMTSTDIPHPPLELLLTVDEETGLTGAIQLGKGMLKAEILINLDSEEEEHLRLVVQEDRIPLLYLNILPIQFLMRLFLKGCVADIQVLKSMTAGQILLS